jgi:hypothetical protein
MAGAVRRREVDLPKRRTVRIPSPDGRWTLIASPFSPSAESTLTLEDMRTGQKSLVRRIDRDMGVAWSPDSKAFYLNDAYGSNVESAYIYSLGASTPLRLDDFILNNGAKAGDTNADDAYFQVIRWIDPSRIQVEFCGHDSSRADHHFDFIYAVKLNPQKDRAEEVRMISQRTRPQPMMAPECRY